MISSLAGPMRRRCVAALAVMTISGSLPHAVAGPRLPVPTTEQRRESAAKVREIFDQEAARATNPAAKSKLAAELLTHASESSDPSDRYVLLDAALQMATDAGDPGTALTAADSLGRMYDTDAHAMKASALDKLATKAPPAALEPVIDALLETVNDFLAADSIEEAEDLAQKAVAAARRSKDRGIQKKAADRLAAVRERKKSAAQQKPFLDRLAVNPNDREAALELGMIRCFQQDEWTAGLPLLTRGSDAALARLARLDLEQGEDKQHRLQLGDAWWDYAETQKAPMKGSAMGRAVTHYSAALPELKGLERTRIEKRIVSAVAQSPGGQKASRSAISKTPGVVFWFDASAKNSLVGQRSPSATAAETTMKIDSWTDLGPDHKLARQPDASKQPAWDRSAFGGRGGLDFDGRQLLEVNAACGNEGTLFLVCEARAVSNMRVLGNHPKFGQSVGLSFRADGQLWMEVSESTSQYCVARSAPATYKASQPLIVYGSWGRQVDLFVNGKPAAAPQTLGWKVRFDSPWGIGNANLKDGSEFFVGTIGEVVAFERQLPPEQARLIAGELMAKWGVR